MHGPLNVKFKFSVVKNCINSTSHPPNQPLTFNTEQILYILNF